VTVALAVPGAPAENAALLVFRVSPGGEVAKQFMSSVMMPMVAAVPSHNDIFEHVKVLLVELFEIEPAKIHLDAQLYQDLEIDSIDAIDLILRLKDYTGKKVKPEDFKSVRTVGDVVGAVETLFKT
jgi:acyl carrier protein